MGSLSATLPWDSAFFGFPTAKLLPARLDRNALAATLAELGAEGVRLVYWASDPVDAESRAAAAANQGFLADEKTTYRIPLASRPAPPFPSAHVIVPLSAVHKKNFAPALLALGHRAGLHSRFRTDPRMPAGKCETLYEEWMRKSLSGERADAVLACLSSDGKSVQGAVTVSASKGAGRIGLIAVAEAEEGHGVGSALTHAALAWVHRSGCGQAEVVTQGRNGAACRLYEKAGFRISRREDFYHFWLSARP